MTRNVIIIHPGSLYVRIGLASDPNPITVLHAIARKRYVGGLVHIDPLLPATHHKVRLEAVVCFSIFVEPPRQWRRAQSNCVITRKTRSL